MDTLRPRENQKGQLHFCGCTLDSETQILQTPSDFVRLRSKLWLVLCTLVQNPNKLVLRDTLIEHIWHGNSYTGEQGLTHAICHIRRILKQNQIEASIVTLPKKGYIMQLKQDVRDDLSITNLNAAQAIDGYKTVISSDDSSPARIKYNFR